MSHGSLRTLVNLTLLQVKAWCYYESRLLGAHHSLLSTYALETMVLYIFNMYCKELSSPLKVPLALLSMHMLQVSCSTYSTCTARS